MPWPPSWLRALIRQLSFFRHEPAYLIPNSPPRGNPSRHSEAILPKNLSSSPAFQHFRSALCALRFAFPLPHGRPRYWDTQYLLLFPYNFSRIHLESLLQYLDVSQIQLCFLHWTSHKSYPCRLVIARQTRAL